MKAYCINLDRRPDRLEHMTAQFRRLKIPFERIPAVDGQRSEVISEARKCGAGQTGWAMSAGAYAIFQSHREVWRRLVASEETYGMVFEDDLVLANGISTYLTDGWVPLDADIVKLETYESRIHLERGPGVPAGSRLLYRLRSRHAGAGCYVISAVAASRLLAASDGVPVDPVDEFIFNDNSPMFKSLIIYQMDRAPAIQGDRWKGPGFVEPWAATSIDARQADPTARGPTAESHAARLRRRLTEEGRALVRHTRYTVTKYG